MNSKVASAFAFLLGGVVGSIATWKLLEKKIDKKYAIIAEEEIASIKKKYTYKKPETEETVQDENGTTEEHQEDEASKPADKPLSIKEYYREQIEKAGYKDYSSFTDEGESENMKKPYVIPPEEFGEEEGYETVSLTYYADEVLTDELGKIVKDVEGVVGKDSLTHFGEYEDDSVFVRNDKKKCDYEILRDPRNYSDLED